MIAMLIAETDYPNCAITEYLEPYGFDIVRYRSAVKAIDNLEEIRPKAVIINAADFPRHWKTIVQFVRSDANKDSVIIVLLINDRFSGDDADKATHIGVQAIVNERELGHEDEKRLVQVFARYQRLDVEGIDDGVTPADATFLFTNPVSDAIVTGKIESLSTRRLIFKADSPAMTADLTEGETVALCSLKLGERIISPQCRVRKNGYCLDFDIVESDSSVIDAIADYIRA